MYRVADDSREVLWEGEQEVSADVRYTFTLTFPPQCFNYIEIVVLLKRTVDSVYTREFVCLYDTNNSTASKGYSYTLGTDTRCVLQLINYDKTSTSLMVGVDWAGGVSSVKFLAVYGHY